MRSCRPRALLGTARLAFCLAVTLLPACAGRTASSPKPADVAGVWEGEGRAGEAILPVTITLERSGSSWTGTVDVPSQYALSYPLTDVRVDDATVAFNFSNLLPPGLFEGQWAGGRIRGRFTSPLGSDTLEGTFDLWRRPRETVPYSTESVRFRNGELELAGTIFRPRASGPFPAVVFVHGSGPQTRDSYIRWFADQFARAGFVTLIYDKRGTGESGGERWPQTRGSFADLADDAVAGVGFLRDHAYVDATRIGIWGLSQGAWIGPLAASRASNLVRFLVMISGGGVSPAVQELYDDEVKLRDLGFDRPAIDEALAYLRLADQYVRTGSDEDWDPFALARVVARGRPWYSHLDRFPQILPREAPVWAGLRTDLDYDPVPVLNGVRVPVLLMLGEEDRLTPAGETALRVRNAVESGGNRDVTVRVLPGADHAVLVKPSPRASWLAERPAANWVAEMLEWASRQR